jgi:AcrR family transcriptional regulator
LSPRARSTTTTSTTGTTRDHILLAATHVFHTLGAARATTKEIAQAAGLSEAALYRHFADKSELFLCVIGDHLARLIAALHDLPNRVGRRTVRANLEDIAEVALPFYDETAPMAAALLAEPDLLARHRAEMASKGNGGPQRSMEALAEYLRAEQRAGRVSPRADPAAAASLLLGACLLRAYLGRFKGQPHDPAADARFVKAVVRTLVCGLDAERIQPDPS